MGYERMTGMGSLVADLMSGAQSLQRFDRANPPPRIGSSCEKVPGGIVESSESLFGVESHQQKLRRGCQHIGSMQVGGDRQSGIIMEGYYCCPRQSTSEGLPEPVSIGPSYPGAVGTKVEACRPGNTDRETVEICLDRSIECGQRTSAKDREMRSRGCNLSYTSGSRQHWCCPPLIQQQVSQSFSWISRVPPWQLILGTGLVVGGVVWGFSNWKKYREAYPATAR